MTEKHTFQSIILKLQEFWAERGCIIWQPYYTQVGAGTMNPATFLRVLGPEPWNVAYVEPSVRPDDGRYGENPNRFQMHYQFQVILKPDPGNPQELYLDSLKAIGINPRQHDIRFVEDNWEQPAISAWGLGWEVWLDGQEITQFTYFQQVGGQTLDPVAVELTYGLDRILIALNDAAAIWDEPWAKDVLYGELRRREEFEHSKYYYEVADVERAREMYELYARECNACLEQGLVLPAHDYVLKCSHTFNILDARGAISLTERQGYFRRMREMARRVAETYLEQRKELEYPLLKENREQRVVSSLKPSLSPVTTPQSFLLEIGTEELPASDVDTALEQLRQRTPVWLAELGLEHGVVKVEATPRRLVIFVDSLSPRQPDREDLVKGPPAERAFDAAGIATPAAMGFAKKNGVDTKDLDVREQDGGKYVFAIVKQKGRPASDILAEALPGFVSGIKFEKSMRWNESGAAFSRPLRWLVALLGDAVIPFEYAGAASGNITRGLRPYDSPEIKIPSAAKYFDVLRDAGVVLDKDERKKLIVEQVKKAAESVKGEAIIEEGLLDEVANLVEKPTAVLGSFDPEFLSLPRDVLISVMKKHQRYFPVEKDGKLMPNFIAVRNGDDQYLDIVRHGNEHVLGARFSDANFFVREDLKHPLEYYRDGLKTLVFQTKLGSMLDKSDRIEKLANELIPMLGLNADEAEFARRAAHLAKADLTTQMVTEMTSLQGIIGREYALRSGEAPAVADAIGEQYRPVPATKVGLTIALADRIDSLVGLFAVDLAPTGAKDPFGLRRAAIGVVQPLIEHDINFDLAEAAKKSAQFQPIPVNEETQAQVLEFVAGRLSVVLKDMGYRYDVVDAVLVAQSDNPAGSARAVKQLQAWVGREDWRTILPAFARCVRITRDQPGGFVLPVRHAAGTKPSAQKQTFSVNERVFVEKEEKDLFKALEKAEKAERADGSVDDFLNAFVPMIPAVNAFFDKVLVMAEDEKLRENRLGLLQRIAALSHGAADLSKLEGF
jgi:glycyl-tRNA synthetase